MVNYLIYVKGGGPLKQPSKYSKCGRCNLSLLSHFESQGLMISGNMFLEMCRMNVSTYSHWNFNCLKYELRLISCMQYFNICNIFCDRAIFPSTLMSSVSSWCWSLLILGALLKHFKDLLTSAEAQILHKAPNLTNLRPARKYFMIWVLCKNAQGQIRVNEWLTNIRNPFLVMTHKKRTLMFLKCLASPTFVVNMMSP